MTFGAPAFGDAPFGDGWTKPKITYTRANDDEVTLTLSQYPIDYFESPKFKSVFTEYDSGVVEKDTFNNRLIIPVSFEMLKQNEADWIAQWFTERAAYGFPFTWFRFSETSPGLSMIWNPSDSSPNITPMSENPAVFFNFSAVFWEVIP